MMKIMAGTGFTVQRQPGLGIVLPDLIDTHTAGDIAQCLMLPAQICQIMAGAARHAADFPAQAVVLLPHQPDTRAQVPRAAQNRPQSTQCTAENGTDA